MDIWSIRSGEFANLLGRIWPGGTELMNHVAQSHPSNFRPPENLLSDSDFGKFWVQAD